MPERRERSMRHPCSVRIALLSWAARPAVSPVRHRVLSQLPRQLHPSLLKMAKERVQKRSGTLLPAPFTSFSVPFPRL